MARDVAACVRIPVFMPGAWFLLGNMLHQVFETSRTSDILILLKDDMLHIFTMLLDLISHQNT